jgi:hypothetical protein
MTNETRSEYLTQDNHLIVRFDEDVACIRTAETACRLSDGEEYLDHGLQRA